MKKIYLFGVALCCMMTVQAKGLPAELFKDGKASYDAATNTLVLNDGFQYSLPKGLLRIETGKPLTIRVEGEALIKASLLSADDLRIEGNARTLSVTSNISGSAIECPKLTIEEGVTLNLLSRNSQEGMYALKCNELIINHAMLNAEVTTANIAVATQKLSLKKAYILKPKQGKLNQAKGCISFGDGIPAKVVHIMAAYER